MHDRLKWSKFFTYPDLCRAYNIWFGPAEGSCGSCGSWTHSATGGFVLIDRVFEEFRAVLNINSLTYDTAEVVL